jgi:hypothetical protein
MPRTAPSGSYPAIRLVGLTTKPRRSGRVENASVYLTGGGIGDAVRAKAKPNTRKRIVDVEVARALARAREAWVATEDPDDRAHSVFQGDDLVPARELPEGQKATPRRYPAAIMVEVLVKGRIRRYSPDAACELLGERVAALAREGVNVGYIGSVTGAISSRSRHGAEGPADLGTVHAQLGDEGFRSLTRQKTRQSRMTEDERRLTREASAMLEAAKGKAR